MMEKEKYEDRVAQAVANFKEGFNCSQSVALAFADVYDVPRDLMLRVSASFGGGIGRMRETCGAVCGMFVLAGLENGSVVGSDQAQKAANYALVQSLAAKFKEKNGTLLCKELLGLVPIGSTGRNGATVSLQLTTQPEERTAAYYQRRPCIKKIEECARIYAEFLQERDKNQKKEEK